MGTIEEIIEQEKRFGWYWHFFSNPDGWRCEGHCGVEALAANLPRPVSRGTTMMSALVVGIRERNQKYGKPGNYRLSVQPSAAAIA